MPIDPQIALNVRPVQPPDVIQSYGNALAVKSHIQQQQLQRQQMQENEERLKQERMRTSSLAEDRDDEQTIQKAFVDTGGDPDKLRSAIAGKVRVRNLQRWDADHLQFQRAAQAMHNDQRVKVQLDNQIVGQEAAGLLQIPYAQRKAEMPAVLDRLSKGGIDTSQYQTFDPNDDNLREVAARSNYLGNIVSVADRQAQEEQRRAAAARADAQASRTEALEQAADRQRKIEDATRAHLGVTNQQEHEEWLRGLDKDVAPLFQNLRQFSPGTQQSVQRIALTAQQRQQDAAREQTQADTTEYRRDNLDLRRSIADQSAALRQAAIDAKAAGSGPKLTPGQLRVEERNINAVEYGTANRTGLHSQRLKIGQMLKDGVDEKGQPLDAPGRHRVEAQMEAVNNSLQNAQFRKADLYSIGKPDPQDIASAKDGEEIEANDGAVWQKKNGVAFFVRPAGSVAPQKPAAPATRAGEDASPPPVGPRAAPTRSQPPPRAATPQASPASAPHPAKEFPRSQLEAFAKANGMTPVQAESALKAQGYNLR